MNWKREINQLAETDEEETPLLFRAFVFRKLHTQKHNSRVQKFPPLKIHRKRAFRNWQTPENKPLLQPEQLQNAPKISCATSLREREGDLRMLSLFASNHQSSRTDATKPCPNIATDQIPIPGPTSTPLSEALVSSVRVSLLVWSPVCCIFWQAFVVVRSSSGEDEAVSVWWWVGSSIWCDRRDFFWMRLPGAQQSMRFCSFLFFFPAASLSVVVSCVNRSSQTAAVADVSFPLHLVCVEAWTCIDSNRGRGKSPLFYAVGACSSFALLSLARFPLSLEFLIHLSYLQLGKMYACLLSVCVCVCARLYVLPTFHLPEIMILPDEHNIHFSECQINWGRLSCPKNSIQNRSPVLHLLRKKRSWNKVEV